jgi:hypothetical protein
MHSRVLPSGCYSNASCLTSCRMLQEELMQENERAERQYETLLAQVSPCWSPVTLLTLSGTGTSDSSSLFHQIIAQSHTRHAQEASCGVSACVVCWQLTLTLLTVQKLSQLSLVCCRWACLAWLACFKLRALSGSATCCTAIAAKERAIAFRESVACHALDKARLQAELPS